MGKRTSYPAGAFSWIELATDASSTKSFYAELFGWELTGDGAGGNGYTVCRIDGDAVCGIVARADGVLAAGDTSSWLCHVTTTDADAIAARARALGGEVVAAAADVSDLGRRAVLEDPQGAVFCVWQPRGWIGAERVNDVGCLCMNELATFDLAEARAFYEGLFGWSTEAVDLGTEGPQVFASNDGRLNASFFRASSAASPHWRPCFTVESTETAVERVRRLGGTVRVTPLDIGDGSLAVAADPAGVVFSMFAGEVDP